MNSIFTGETFRAWLENAAAWLATEIFTSTNLVYTAMQIPGLVGTGVCAWCVHDFITPVLEARIQRSAADDDTKFIGFTLCRLIFPALWVIGLWIAISIGDRFGWPHATLWIANNLLAAWIVIRLALILVRDPIWSRAITIVAYTIAVLNVLDLLQPTMLLLDRLAVSAGSMRISVLMVLQGMFSLGVLLWAAVLLSRILQRHVERLPNLTPSVRVLFSKLLKASLLMLAVLVSLTMVGIDITALAVFGGAVGVGIGFGLQKVVSNLISGVILLMDRSLKPGDIIQIRDTYGWIAALGARYVSVETRDGVEYLIPNEDIITQQVINWTHKNDLARIKVQVRVSFDSDVDMALDLLVKATDRPTRILRSPEPRALLTRFGDNGLELELRFWIHDVQNGIRNISSEVMLEIWALFREHGIRIPLPQHDLHLRDTPFDTMSGAGWRGSTPPRGWPPQDRSPPGRPNSGVGRFPWPRR